MRIVEEGIQLHPILVEGKVQRDYETRKEKKISQVMERYGGRSNLWERI